MSKQVGYDGKGYIRDVRVRQTSVTETSVEEVLPEAEGGVGEWGDGGGSDKVGGRFGVWIWYRRLVVYHLSHDGGLSGPLSDNLRPNSVPRGSPMVFLCEHPGRVGVGRLLDHAYPVDCPDFGDHDQWKVRGQLKMATFYLVDV